MSESPELGSGQVEFHEDRPIIHFANSYETKISQLGDDTHSSAVDAVEHPSHYTSHPAGYEAIDIIEWNPYPNLANVIKYCWRVSWGGKQDDIEDLKKMVWYGQREIARREYHG